MWIWFYGVSMGRIIINIFHTKAVLRQLCFQNDCLYNRNPPNPCGTLEKATRMSVDQSWSNVCHLKCRNGNNIYAFY